VITPENDDLDRILCLELGADDVLTQPVNSRELLARMRAVLRRRARLTRADGVAVFRFAGFRFDPARRELWAPSGAPILLTATEANLLRILLSQGEDRLTRTELAEAARVAAREGGRALDLHISRLRRKLEEQGGGRGLILTHRNLGYQMACPVVFG
jgi:two-component system OmpR family response regulator